MVVVVDEPVLGRLEYAVPQKRALVEDVYDVPVADHDEIDADAFDVDALHAEFSEYGERLAREGMPVNCGAFLAERRAAGDRLVFEGAQGTAIDLDHGIYPYVTSSNPTAGAAAVGTGLGPGIVGDGEVLGIVKAYLSRVGTGPLPTELGRVDGQTPAGGGRPDASDVAEYVREEGGEYGTVTGRPRRVGWLDVPMLRHAARASGFTGIAVNHLDVLAGLDEVKVGHAYDRDGKRLYSVPTTTERWGECEPVYRTFEGWPEVDWAAAADEGFDALPGNARACLNYVGDELGAPLSVVGVGPGRAESLVLDHPFA